MLVVQANLASRCSGALNRPIGRSKFAIRKRCLKREPTIEIRGWLRPEFGQSLIRPRQGKGQIRRVDSYAGRRPERRSCRGAITPQKSNMHDPYTFVLERKVFLVSFTNAPQSGLD